MRPFKHLTKTQSFFFPALGLITALTFSPVVFSQEKIIIDQDIRASLIKDTNQTAAGPKKGVDARSLGGTPASFGSGFDSTTPTWTKWEPAEDDSRQDDYSSPNPKYAAPSLGSLDAYKTSPQDDANSIALKIDAMLRGVSGTVADLTQAGYGQTRTPEFMMTIADRAASQAEPMYNDISAMYDDVDIMKAQLTRNYETYNNSDQSQERAQKFNAQSDAMADRVAGMRRAVQGMSERAVNSRDLIDGMFEMLDEINDSGKDASAVREKFDKHIKDVSSRFEAMAGDLKKQGLDHQGSLSEARQYIANLSEYAKNAKAFSGHQIDYTLQVRKYLQDIRNYLNNLVNDLAITEKDMAANEEYFRNAKIKTDNGISRDIQPMDAGGACDDLGKKLKKKLTSQQECQKDCKGVCRGHGQGCFECPSGSPDSCADVGGQPADFSWCQPGGICYDDPMMYCVPFGAVGPQGEKLQCTNCKQRPDECFQKVDPETTTLTNCTLRCWDGTCIYVGKYKEQEWDGKKESIHCYKCKTPPGPPTCEDLGWGTTWLSDCEKMCPAPGKCVKENIKVPGAPQPPPDPNVPPPGGKQDGQCGGGQCGGVVGGGQDGAQGGQTGGSSVSGGRPPGGGEGTKPKPPTGGTGAPTAGGGAIAGGPTPSSTPTPSKPEDKPAGGTQTPPPDPGTTQPKPQPPPAPDKPKPPEPPAPPSNPDIDFYKKWHSETMERIKSREDIINDPNEGDAVKDEARRQLESMTKWKERIEARIKELEERERAKNQQSADEQKRREEYERTRPRYVDYGAEMRRKMQEFKLKRLKEATEALKNKLQEARDVLAGRRERLQKIQEEIARLEAENRHFTENKDNVDSTVAKNRIKENLDRIAQLKQMRAQLAKKLQEAQRQYAEELEKAKTEYQRALWSVDESSRRRAESSRIDEYFDLVDELKRKEQTREVRRQTFESMVKNLEGARDEARARGDSSAADEFQRQIDNIKRRQAEWDASQERQLETLKRQISDIEVRNMYEGVGPDSVEGLGQKLTEYGKIFQDRLNAIQHAITKLEGMTLTREQTAQLNALKQQAEGLRGAIEGIKAKQQVLQGGNQISAEERQRIHDTTTRVAAGAMNEDAAKSFARLALESIGEEGVHNLNPFVAAKKSIAFGVGIVEGVGSALGGLAKLGWEVVDTLGEGVANTLGIEEYVFGSENMESIVGMVDAVGSNANFDGVIKAVVAAGGAIDAKLNSLSKGDIDWNTANFGGEIVGEVVVGDMIVASILGKTMTAIKGVDAASDALNAGAKAADALEDAATAVRTGERAAADAATHLDDTTKLPAFDPPPAGTTKLPMEVPGSTVMDDVADAGRTGSRTGDVPKTPDGTAPPTRAPPPDAPTTPKVADPAPAGTAARTAEQMEEAAKRLDRAGVDEFQEASYVGPDGKKVTVQVGEELGHGSTSTVFADPNDATKAIRITKPGGIGGSGSTRATQLDAAGRQAVEGIQKPGGPIRVVEPGTPTRVNDPSSPLNGKTIEIVERLPGGDAKKMLNGGPMSEGQARAMADAMTELNKNGYAWMDNHPGNYGFKQLDGTDKWQVVVLDPGGIVPMKGATTAERAQNAAALQRHLNTPEEGMREFYKTVSEGTKRHMDDVERGLINQQFGDKIDYGKLGVDGMKDIGYYPFGTLDYPEVQKLF
jgi:hypothetical protein